MKKIFYAIALLAVAAVAFTACNKENKDENKVVKRLTQCGDKWDVYYFTYNEDGKLSEVKRNLQEGGTYERTWTFKWEGNVGTAKYVKDGEEKGDWTFTLGSNGFLSSWSNEWGDTWGFTYDKDNYLTNIKRTDKNPMLEKANCVWQDGNLVKWSRFNEKKDADGNKVKDGDGNQVYEEQFKIQSFLADENVGGIFADASDKAGVDRWIFEVGFCGKASKNLLDQAAWEGSESIAVHTYEKDADGFVTKVNKVYGNDDPEIYEYAWEVVK